MAANADFLQRLQAARGGNTAGFQALLSDSSFLQRIDPRLAHPYLVAFTDSMSSVFLVASAILVLAFVVAWFLPHVELRSGSAYTERGQDERGSDSALVSVGATGDLDAAAQAPAPQHAPDPEPAPEPRSQRKAGRHRAQAGEQLT